MKKAGKTLVIIGLVLTMIGTMTGCKMFQKKETVTITFSDGTRIVDYYVDDILVKSERIETTWYTDGLIATWD